MVRCSSVALSTNTAAAAISRPAPARCQRGHRERKWSFVARVSTVGARGSKRADFLKTSTNSCSFLVDTTVANILDYDTVQGTANLSVWNRIFKFWRRGRDGRRSRKLLSLCHTYGSEPRSPSLPCQIMDQWKSSELEQNYGISYR